MTLPSEAPAHPPPPPQLKTYLPLALSLFFVTCSCEEKDCYRVVSVGQLGLTAARTAGTVTVVLRKSFFRISFLVLSRKV